MKTVLTLSALLALTVPALAANASFAGKSVLDQQGHAIGTVRYTANINGQENAVMTIPTAMYGDATVALPISELRTAGNGVMVSMSVDQLVHMPCAVAPCSQQKTATR